MTYQDYTDTLSIINTGSTIPDRIELVLKMVCGKIARRRINDLVRLAEIETEGEITINLKEELPDFLDFKLDIENDNKIIYTKDSDGFPTFYKIVSDSEFEESTGNVVKRAGNRLYFKEDPVKIYFRYFSFYCWEDVDTGVAKETPTNNDDFCLLNPVFDDVIVDGSMLYIARREKEDSEYTKNVQEWEKRINETIYYS